MCNQESILKKLTSIYNRYLIQFRENTNSKQMCCMWSTDDPPDVLTETSQLVEIEEAFGIKLSEDLAVEIYDLSLSDAANRIKTILDEQC